MTKKQSCKRGQCRIIGGRWRGRVIRFDDAKGLRPTTDRIRETVFNWLQPYLANSVCLDAYAGSGVLGFEAVSRGAAKAVLIDNNSVTAAQLKTNSALLQADGISVQQTDVANWLQSQAKTASSNASFNLVFLDPPFHQGLLSSSFELLLNSGCLAEDAIIYAEHAVDEVLELPENWQCIKVKRSGQVEYGLYQHRQED